jgi:hypothetical protein
VSGVLGELPTGPIGCRSDRLLGPAARYAIDICMRGKAIGDMASVAKNNSHDHCQERNE